MSNKLLIILSISASLFCLNLFVILPSCWRPEPSNPEVAQSEKGIWQLWTTLCSRTHSTVERTRSLFRASSTLVITRLWGSPMARFRSVALVFVGRGTVYDERHNEFITGNNQTHHDFRGNASTTRRRHRVTPLSQRAQNTTGTDPLPMKRRLPDAIIVGVKKGGTRALLEYLKLHPDIRAPGPEIHFFDRYFFRGFDWYRSQMPETLSGQRTIEKTPSYFITRAVPDRIHAMKPDMKLIVVVRNPITRAISDYSQKLSKHNSHNGAQLLGFESFAFRRFNTDPSNNTLLKSNLTHPKIDHPESKEPMNASRANSSEEDLFSDFDNVVVNTTWRAIKLGLYHKHVRRWLKAFPLGNMHFVSGERLITHPAEEVNLIEAFLGLKPMITDKHFYFNASKGFPCLKKSPGNEEPHCLGRTKGRLHPTIPDWAIHKLKLFYEPHNRQFYELVRRDFEW